MDTRGAKRNPTGLLLAIPFLAGSGGMMAVKSAWSSFARSPLAFPSPVADLGTVAPGGAVERTIWLENRSSTPVRIEAVTHSCGCTTTRAADLVPGGGRISFAVRLVAVRRPGDERQVVRVFARGHAEPLTLSILAHVVARPSSPSVKAMTVKDDGEPLPCTVR